VVKLTGCSRTHSVIVTSTRTPPPQAP